MYDENEEMMEQRDIIMEELKRILFRLTMNKNNYGRKL
jgi:hypothetical protein